MRPGDRYEGARSTMPITARDALKGAVAWCLAHPWQIRQGVDFVREGVRLRASLSYEPGPAVAPSEEFRVVVSRQPSAGSSRVRLPSWEDIVAVRATVWPDRAVVHQILPGEGDHYVAITECLHLWGPRP